MYLTEEEEIINDIFLVIREVKRTVIHSYQRVYETRLQLLFTIVWYLQYICLILDKNKLRIASDVTFVW